MTEDPMPTIWREPAHESIDIYPGLTVHDGRVTGSITAGQSRLPLWAFAGIVARHGWEEAQSGWEPEQYGWTAEKHDLFIADLLEQRGEFGRLLCLLADVERRQTSTGKGWWEKKTDRARVVVQLRRCLSVLGES